MTIADLSTVWVTALVPEKDVGAVSKNQDAEVQPGGLSRPGAARQGAVRVRRDRAGFAPQQDPDRVRERRLRAQAQHVRDRHAARGRNGRAWFCRARRCS